MTTVSLVCNLHLNKLKAPEIHRAAMPGCFASVVVALPVVETITMRKAQLHFCLVCMAGVFLVFAARMRGNTQDNAVVAILNAPNAATAEREFSRLLATAETPALKQLMAETPDAVALRAAWQEVLNEFKRTKRTKASEFGNSGSAHRFLGFFEGRLHSAPPDWWATALLSGQIESNDVLTFRVPNVRQLYREAEGGYKSRPGTGISIRDGTTTLTAFGKSLGVCTAVFRELSPRDQDFVDSLFDRNECYVAVHADAGDECVLGCFDTRSSRLKWKATVWAADRSIVYGRSWPCVSLAKSHGNLLVFGFDARAMYAEGFDAETGKSAFRFCTGYLSALPP